MTTAAPGSNNLFVVATSLVILAISVYFLVMGKDVLIPLVLGIHRLPADRLSMWSSG